jgi:hypothetical protein
MIFDIYEQSDLFKIARCGRQSTLIVWLTDNKIPYMFDSKQKIIAHKKAVDAGLGVEEDTKPEQKVKLWLGNQDAA